MADNKKYYYMRLKEDFFNSRELIVLESHPDGYLYSNILLKLYLLSLREDGRLMLNKTVPYNAQMIAAITRHKVETVEAALKEFLELDLIEVLDSGAIYMLDIQNYIGLTSTEADRINAYRKRIKREKSDDVQIPYKCSTNVHQRLENREYIYMRKFGSEFDAREDEKRLLEEQRLTVQTAQGASETKLVSHATTLESPKEENASERLKVEKMAGGSRNHAKTLQKSFDEFYSLYPKKRNKQEAFKAWKRLAPDEALIAEIKAALEWQKASDDWKKDAGQFIPYPASWLNGHRWEDEQPTSQQKQKRIERELQ